MSFSQRVNELHLETLDLEGDIDVDSNMSNTGSGDSTHGVDGQSNISMASTANMSVLRHGRRYPAVKEYWGPTDERALDTMAAIHMAMCILDSQQPNPFFRSPLSDQTRHVLDIGTGEGNWAIDVADRYPSLTVRGVDITPPTAKWVPQNCILEVDDITKEWVWAEEFDLVHIRQFYGALTPAETKTMYARIYENLAPGGWIEQVEFDPNVLSMNNRMPPDALFQTWGAMFMEVCSKANHPINMFETMRGDIEAAGFTNVHEVRYKCPVGGWAKHKLYKDAGIVNLLASKEGVEGYAMYLLTHHGLPEPWSAEKVHEYIAKIKRELDQPWNLYQHVKRVYAQKPFRSSLHGKGKVIESLRHSSEGIRVRNSVVHTVRADRTTVSSEVINHYYEGFRKYMESGVRRVRNKGRINDGL